MKKLMLIIAVLFATNCTFAQNATQDKTGNYVAVKSPAKTGKDTGKTFTDNKGNVYPVLESVNGKLYYMRTSKTGYVYKCYIKVS